MLATCRRVQTGAPVATIRRPEGQPAVLPPRVQTGASALVSVVGSPGALKKEGDGMKKKAAATGTWTVHFKRIGDKGPPEKATAIRRFRSAARARDFFERQRRVLEQRANRDGQRFAIVLRRWRKATRTFQTVSSSIVEPHGNA